MGRRASVSRRALVRSAAVDISQIVLPYILIMLFDDERNTRINNAEVREGGVHVRAPVGGGKKRGCARVRYLILPIKCSNLFKL